jgi:hypothetical protein
MKLNLNSLSIDISCETILHENTDLHYSVSYNRDTKSDLNSLCDKYGSDKGEVATEGHPYPWVSHTYADFYDGRFGHCRDHIKTVFECGIGTNNVAAASNMGQSGKPGASLRVWRDYFPNAHIHGADVDRSTLFSDTRISTYHVDQTSPEAIALLWTQVPVVEFDLMIDDGLHTFEAGVCLFENSFQKLRKNGIYVIEDVIHEATIKFLEYFKQRDLRVEFVHLTRKDSAHYDNSLIVITKR